MWDTDSTRKFKSGENVQLIKINHKFNLELPSNQNKENMMKKIYKVHDLRHSNSSGEAQLSLALRPEKCFLLVLRKGTLCDLVGKVLTNTIQ